MLELGLFRLTTAFSTWPSPGEWGVTFLLFAAFACATLVVLRVSGLFKLSVTKLPVRHILLLTVIAVFTPSLLEETLYRVLLLPYPDEAVSSNGFVLWGGVSLLLYVVAHPLLAWTLWPWARPIFCRSSFLVIVFSLGVVCTLAYWFTGSVWAPVFIHWATIMGWKILFGGPDFNLGDRGAPRSSKI